MVGSVTLGLVLCLLLEDLVDCVVEALVAAVEPDDPGLSRNAEGREEKSEADHDERSSKVSLRRDIRGGRIESTVGRCRRCSLLLRSESWSCSPCSSCSSVDASTGPAVASCSTPLASDEACGDVLVSLRDAETWELSAFSWGRGRRASSSVMGGGDPSRTKSSEYTGGGDISLMTRKVLRGGGCTLNCRSRSLLTLPLRDGGLCVVFAELLRESWDWRTGAGWMMGTGAGGGTAISPFGVCR